MEEQLHRSHDHDPGIEEEYERGGETKSTMKKVIAKVDKLKATIMHGHGHQHGEVHKDEALTLNDSQLVKSGLVEPTFMGTPVLAEDLYSTHSDIVDPPVRTFAQWEEEEEEKNGDPPPVSTAYGLGSHMTDQPRVPHYDYEDRVDQRVILEEGRHDAPLQPGDPPEAHHHTYGADADKGELMSSMEKSSGMERDPTASNSSKNQASVTDPTHAGVKEAGITDVLRSFDKMKVYNEPDNKSPKSDQNKPTLYTGSHNQFAPEPVANPPLDTIADDPSNPNSSYKQRMSSATSAVADKATSLKDSIVSKLSSSDETKSNPKSSSSTVYPHMVAETLSATLGPVYEKVADVGSSVMSKMQSGTQSDKAPESKGVGVKEYLVNTFKPGDDDKALSDVITHAFHREKVNEPLLETSSTTTTYVIRDDVGRRL